ncbi:hypothetical protein H920_14564 [Fukomys damarensis]|uniref:Uncharacterized protein n=1 Tax=Fukomys damarensis TaxID=885580 RepID=A0A091D1K7_FUKDA|nr:hypothetical protein H920_14564 [Fukomys damarensis]
MEQRWGCLSPFQSFHTEKRAQETASLWAPAPLAPFRSVCTDQRGRAALSEPPFDSSLPFGHCFCVATLEGHQVHCGPFIRIL